MALDDRLDHSVEYKIPCSWLWITVWIILVSTYSPFPGSGSSSGSFWWVLIPLFLALDHRLDHCREYVIAFSWPWSSGPFLEYLTTFVMPWSIARISVIIFNHLPLARVDRLNQSREYLIIFFWLLDYRLDQSHKYLITLLWPWSIICVIPVNT